MQQVSSVDDTLHRQLGFETTGFTAQLLPKLMDLVRSSRRLPLGEEHAIRRGSRDFLQASKDLGQRSLGAAYRTLRFADPVGHQSSSIDDIANFNVVIDSIDTVLEKVDGCLKEAVAVAEGKEPSAPEIEDEPAALGAGSWTADGSRLPTIASKIPKPQVRWRQLIDNQRTEFVPRLIVKHHQKVPLDPKLVAAQQKAGIRKGGASGASASAKNAQEEPAALRAHLGALGVGEATSTGGLPHPYEDELRALSWPEPTFKPKEPQRSVRLEDTPLVWVRTEAELRAMIGEIKATCMGKEIAVDVEHHDFRSYRGFVCLVQISTRQKDFLVDPFDIFEEMHMLNEITADPKIVKVLHGADRDVIWLQRDFSIYIVNMFDTGQATRALKFQGGFSLANLVRHYCSIKLDKTYQTADWRERPLSSEMAHYARLDTHYLLYCYDCLWNALLVQQTVSETSEGIAGVQATEEGRQALRLVLEKSAELCRSQYKEAPFDAANVAMQLCERFGMKHRPLESRQFAVLQALVAWRDNLARSMDESWNLISPDPALWRVALALPTNATRLRAACNPLPLTMQHKTQEVVELVTRCCEEGGVPGAAVALASASPAFAPAAPPTVQQTPPAPSVGSSAAAAAATATPQTLRNWPTRTPTSVRPVIQVKAHGSGVNGTVTSGASLATMFDEESSGDEVDAPMEDAAEAEQTSESMKAAEILGGFQFAAAAPTPAPAAVDTPAAPEAPAEPAPSPAAPAQPAVALREEYNLPRPGKKKKKKVPAAGAGVVAPASAPSTMTSLATQVGKGDLSSFEAEAASFRAALQGAFGVAGATNLAAVSPAAPAQAAGTEASAKPMKKRKRAVSEGPVAAGQSPASQPAVGQPAVAQATAVAGKPGANGMVATAPIPTPAPAVATPAPAMAGAPPTAAALPATPVIPSGAFPIGVEGPGAIVSQALKKKKKKKGAVAEQFAQSNAEVAEEQVYAASDPYAAVDPYL